MRAPKLANVSPKKRLKSLSRNLQTVVEILSDFVREKPLFIGARLRTRLINHLVLARNKRAYWDSDSSHSINRAFAHVVGQVQYDHSALARTTNLQLACLDSLIEAVKSKANPVEIAKTHLPRITKLVEVVDKVIQHGPAMGCPPTGIEFRPSMERDFHFPSLLNQNK
jgi:hypothetical protein